MKDYHDQRVVRTCYGEGLGPGPGVRADRAHGGGGGGGVGELDWRELHAVAGHHKLGGPLRPGRGDAGYSRCRHVRHLQAKFLIGVLNNVNNCQAELGFNLG